MQTQLERCEAYAENNQYVVLERFQDSKSGETLERPGLDALYTYISQHPVDVVVVYDPDRLSRGGPAHTAIIEMRLEKHNVSLVYVLGDYNSDSPESALSLMIKQSIAWYENQQRRERITRGRYAKAKSGKVVIGARPPYGYDDDDGDLVINEEEAAIVRQIFSWLLSGKSTYDIAKRLSDQKVPTRADKTAHMRKHNSYGIWGPTSVKRILNNDTYTGTWHYGKTRTVKVDGKRRHVKRPRSEWVAVPVPVIIDTETFQAAQKQLQANRATARRNTKFEYLLQGMVYCTCGLRCKAKPKK
ncbi:recombinase family protein [Chloroflexi bacterium TSY]|nr:recombinase family protein [Chloroflexi bacterium TSY]